MTEPSLIAVFYSKGRSFLDVLRTVRQHHPGARITAIVPPGYPMPPEERAAADAVTETGQARYGACDGAGLIRLARQVRALRPGLFVITFDSPKLELLAAWIGVPAAWCTFDGQLVPIRPTLANVPAHVVGRHLRGRTTYAGIWLATRLLRVGPKPR